MSEQPQIIKKCGNKVVRKPVGIRPNTTASVVVEAGDIVWDDFPTCPCYSQIEMRGWPSSALNPFPDGTLCKHNEPGDQLKNGTWEWQCVYPEERKKRGDND